MVKRSRLMVVIPCYNCAPQIVRVLSDFKSSAALLDRIEKIIVIDNRSHDETLAVVKKWIAENPLDQKVTILRNQDNYGLGGTHKVAFKIALAEKFDLLAIVHGDHQATTLELNDLLDKYENQPELAAVLGSRFSFGSKLKGYSITRILGNLALNIVYTVLAFRKTADLGSGLNLFRVSSFSEKEIAGLADAFTFNMDLLLLMYSKGCSLAFYPITWSEKDQVSNARNFQVGWKALKTVLAWRFLVHGTGTEKVDLQSYYFEKI